MQVLSDPREAVRVKRDVFATGRLASHREQLEHLKQRAEIARISQERHPSHANEIHKLYADQAVADFLAAHPSLAEPDDLDGSDAPCHCGEPECFRIFGHHVGPDEVAS